VVGALVGFHGWPDGAVGQAVPSVPTSRAPQRVVSVSREVRVRVRTPAVKRAAQAVGSRSATVGLVKQVPVSSPQPIGYPVAYAPGQAGPSSPAAPPAHPAPATVAAPSEPGTPAPPSAPPTSPEGIQALVSQLLGSTPPPAAPDQLLQPGESLQIGIPIVGTTVTVPPVHAR
jgi:hypothetical protein